LGAACRAPTPDKKNQNDMRNPTKPIRKNIRLKDFDYSSAGDYFLTLISHQRKNIFGEIDDGKITLNRIGKIIEETWEVGATHEAPRNEGEPRPCQQINNHWAWWWDLINPP